MADLISYLRAFNRKERFFLVGAALGNPGFTLSAPFRGKLDSALGTSIPEDAFVAMDYHLDWVYASLYLDAHRGSLGPHANAETLIRAQQEDIDLIVAYRQHDVCHLILLEAKGDSAWSNKQMKSKIERLRAIFGEEGTAWSGVVPHLVLVSPRHPRLLKTECWPAWTLRERSPTWSSMDMGLDPVKVTRCTADGTVASTGDHWKVIPGAGRRHGAKLTADPASTS